MDKFCISCMIPGRLNNPSCDDRRLDNGPPCDLVRHSVLHRHPAAGHPRRHGEMEILTGPLGDQARRDLIESSLTAWSRRVERGLTALSRLFDIAHPAPLSLSDPPVHHDLSLMTGDLSPQVYRETRPPDPCRLGLRYRFCGSHS